MYVCNNVPVLTEVGSTKTTFPEIRQEDVSFRMYVCMYVCMYGNDRTVPDPMMIVRMMMVSIMQSTTQSSSGSEGDGVGGMLT